MRKPFATWVAMLMALLLSIFEANAQNSPNAPPSAGSAQGMTSVYKPKFPGDPAHSDAESGALGYMRVVLRAQREYKKRHQHFAESLPSLAGTGSFTKRMSRSNDRGDYTVEFHSKKKGESFTLTMIPKQYDPQHRAFFATDDGIIHAEEGKPASEESPKIK
ncbi:MAG TPA: hypothetical protein VFI95_22885 [Terriglobales bacterium]|nr:hypothetical protein [Terriglobales bacterium]